MAEHNLEFAAAASPRVLIYATALTCGLLAALALEIFLARVGFDVAALWSNLFSARTTQLRIAGPWWAIAGTAFIVSGAVAAALSRTPPPWRRFRLLRWLAGALIVFVLADIGHSPATPGAGAAGAAAAAGARVAASLTVLAVAAVMALCGAYFTARR